MFLKDLQAGLFHTMKVKKTFVVKLLEGQRNSLKYSKATMQICVKNKLEFNYLTVSELTQR